MINTDNEVVARYDSVSRALHWSMALLFVCMYSSAAVRHFWLDSQLDKLVWPVHKPVGALLLVMLVLRICWSVVQRQSRPPSMSQAARIGHALLYLLMFLIPSIGLLRQYGSGRAFSAFGLPLFEDRAEKFQWMIDLGSNFHGLLGWALLVLVCGHVGAVVVHYRRGNKLVIKRMIG